MGRPPACWWVLGAELLLVAGHLLDELRAVAHVRLHLIERWAEEAEIRAVYAAAVWSSWPAGPGWLSGCCRSESIANRETCEPATL